MKMHRLFVVAMATLGMASFSLSASADVAAGKAKFASVCSECHDASDFEGEDAKALAGSLKKIVAGQAKHKTALKLTDAEITDLAAYMATGGK